MIGQQEVRPAAGDGSAKEADTQVAAATEHYTFTHVIDGRAYEFEFDYTSPNHLDVRAKLRAAVEAWNAANPDRQTSEEKVLTSRWGIRQEVDPHSGFKRPSADDADKGMGLVFRRVVDGQTVKVDFAYKGDMGDSNAKMKAAVAAWNAKFPESQTTPEEVRANGRWSIFVPMTRESGTPCIF